MRAKPLKPLPVSLFSLYPVCDHFVDRLTRLLDLFPPSRRPVVNLGRCSARDVCPLTSRQAPLPCRARFAICPPRVPDQCPAVFDPGPPTWYLSLPGGRRFAVLFPVQHADAGVRVRFVRFFRFVGEDAPRRRRRGQGRPCPGLGVGQRQREWQWHAARFASDGGDGCQAGETVFERLFGGRDNGGGRG